jgi:uncharacterized membrane protein
MGSAEQPRPDGTTPPRDVLLVAALLPLVFLLQLAATGSWAALTRKFWLDELLTRARVTDPSPGHFVESLGEGFDCNPPAYYVALRGYVQLVHGTDEVSLRLFSLLVAWALLVGIYLLVRRTLGPLPALLAVLATEANPLVIEYALEARGYIAWLACAVWYAYFLRRTVDGPNGLLHGILAGVVAVLLCTVHWFGILALGLISAGELCFGGGSFRARLVALLPAAAGLIALGACLPLLARQRAAFTVPTWIPRPTPFLIVQFLGGLLPVLILVAALGTLAIVLLRARRAGSPGFSVPRAGDLRGLAGLLSLGLLPFVVLALSYIVQPSTLPKYALPTAAIFGPLVAWLFARAPRPAALVLCLLVVVAGSVELWRLAGVRRGFNEQIDHLIETLRAHTGDAPIVIEDRGLLYAVTHHAPDLAPRCSGFYFEEDRPGGLNPSLVHERELGTSYERFYGRPHFAHLSELRGRARFFVVPIGTDAARLEGDYPGLRLTRVTDELYEMSAPSSGSHSRPQG